MTVAVETLASIILPHIHSWWRERCQESWSAEILSILDNVSLDAIARDHGVSRWSLIEIARGDPAASREMIQMMRALHIDPAEAAMEENFEEMEDKCARCPNKASCRNHLANGTAAHHLDEFCANAEALHTMQATPHLLEGHF